MSRADTIQEDRWRVQVRGGAHGLVVSHESPFTTLVSAENYYDTLHVPGSSKRLQLREAGAERFETLKEENMTAAETGDKTFVVRVRQPGVSSADLRDQLACRLDGWDVEAFDIEPGRR